MSKFVHLHTHSHYSLLDGLSKIDALVLRAKELGMEAVALTDHGNLYGAVEFYKKAKKAGIKPIIGVEAYVAKGSRFSKTPRVDNVRYHLVLLAKDKTGYKNITRLVTASHLEGFYYKPRIDKELLEKHHEGIICLSGCFSGELCKLIRAGNFVEAEEVAAYYKNIFGDDYYIEIQQHTPDLHPKLIEIARKLDIPLVATQDSHYLTPDEAPIHEVLLAIQTNNRLENEDKFSFRDYDISFKSSEDMAETFKEVPEAIENTVKVADKCNFEFNLERTLLPKFELPNGENPNFYLRKLAEEGLQKRYAGAGEEAINRLNYELDIIEKTGFADYFLIVQDFVVWAKNHGIVVGPGRGSAAGSLVSYVLGITDVDPISYELLFERFLNPERIEMPDIDLDFADRRRDEVIGYIKDKYGEDKVAQIITFGTMMSRAAVRDAGRALGFPYSFCDEIAKLIPFRASTEKSPQLHKDVKTIPDLKMRYESDQEAKKLLDTAMKLEGVARHASVHACGVVISPEPLFNYMPLQRSPQDESSVITQFEMHSVGALGLLKIDLLGLRTLTIIEETIRLVKEIKGEKINISEVPLNDENTYKLLRTGETTGVFQFESAGMRRYMKEFKPSELEDLIALVALYRPGPIELIPSFIKRKFGKEKVTYMHPRLEPILKNTYGIGVYQEQMMRIARDLAKFSLPEADTLRKAIGKKIKSLLDAQKEKLIKGMIENGIDKKTAERIWELFPPFARYGFNRSHAVCYAIIGYQTAYLKTHYPVEFTTALLNNTGGDVERTSFLINEARRMGTDVLPPDVNKSVAEFVPEGKNIRFGIMAIKNIGTHITEVIVSERLRGGPFESLTDFVTRIHDRDLNRKSLEALTKSGALDSLGIERMATLKSLDEILKISNGIKKENDSSQVSLFGEDSSFEIRLQDTEPASKTERLTWEKELLGLYVTDHPLKDYFEKVENANKLPPIREVCKPGNEGRIITTCGIISKIQRKTTRNGAPMIFAKIEDLTDNIEVLVFHDTLKQNPLIWEEGNVIRISGRISRKDNEPKIICNEAKKLNL